jgi:hypothetical protein
MMIESEHREDDGTLATSPSPPAGGSGSSSWRVFWGSAAALGVVLLGLLLWIDNGYVAVPDEGIYSAQAANLADGAWASPRPWPEIDTTGDFTGLVGAQIVGTDQIPYSRHPAYPLLLVVGYWPGGQAGMLLLSVLGTWSAAVAAGLIARRLKPAYGVCAMWITGIASPLIFDAYLVVAHSIAAALAGFAFLGLDQALKGRAKALLYALPAIVGMVLLRSEGVLLAFALGAAIGLSAFRFRRLRPIGLSLRTASIGAVVSLVGAVTYVMDTRWAKAISGVAGYGTDVSELVLGDRTGPASAAWIMLANPTSGSWLNADLWRPLTALFTILAAVAFRFLPKQQLLPLALLLAAAVMAVVQLFSTPDFVSGLFAAFPLLPAGLLLLTRTDLRKPLVTRALLSTGLFVVAVVLTTYSEGGAAEWGGRFLHLLLPILVPLAVAGLAAGGSRLDRPSRLLASSSLAVVCICLSTTALRANHDSRRIVEDIVSGSLAELEDARSSSDVDVVLVSLTKRPGAARFFWQHVQDNGVLAGRQLPDFVALLRSLGDDDSFEIVVAGDYTADFFQGVLGEPLEADGWRVGDLGTTDGENHALVLFSRSTD